MRVSFLVCLMTLVGSTAAALPRPAAPQPRPSPAAETLSSGAVKVAPDGGVAISDHKVGRLALPAPPRRLNVREVEVSQHKLVQVKVSGAGGRAAELVVTAAPTLEVLFNGSTGPQDVDGEWSRHLRLDQNGLLVFQRRDGLVRCDGAPIYLFPKRYDFQSGRFRPVAARVPGQGLPELRASRRATGVPAGAPLNTFRLTGASTQSGDGQAASNLTAPVAAEDGRADTPWTESLGGWGQGEFLTAQAQSSPYRLKALRIVPGDAASAKRFRESNRLKSAVLHLGRKRSYRIVFPRDPSSEPGRPDEPFWVELPEPVNTTCATLVIDEVYRGSAAKSGDGGRTAIAELRFFTELEFAGGLAQLARDLDSHEDRRGEAAVAVLIRLKGEGLELAARDLATARGAGLGRRVRVLAASGLPASAAPLAKALGRAEGAPRSLALEALGRLGSTAVPPLIELLSSNDTAAARADAARVLGRLGGSDARRALLQAAGRGPDSLRAGIVEGLSSLSSEEDLTAVLEALRDSAGGATPVPTSYRADLIYALGRLGRHQPKSTARELATLWDRAGASFEERYRILASVGRLAPDAELALVERAAGDSDPVLRWSAVEQAERVAGAAPLPVLRRAVEDRYPPVRIAAAVALVHRSYDVQAGRLLAAQLRRERWPAVGLALAEALSRHCSSDGNTALRDALASPMQGVDGRALHSLARCDPPGVADELLALARDQRRRTTLRTQALGLLGPARAAARLPQLVRLFDELRQEAARSDAGEAVAVWAAGALAEAGGAAATEALSDALALDPHEPIRAAAALALGRLCARSSQQVLERARGDSAKMVQRAAQAGLQRCAGRWR